ncbi:NTF2-like N-terminal transpeptidase domain-containing protein [Dactylosporangium sp. NPDC005572]|uniref:NTF2-like N-terminal transpeptidase domain-containing protein n=1 Tax=Dactylosporangium sp. NPDC005572 TaxID=3156889 RepID=UPI0033B50190
MRLVRAVLVLLLFGALAACGEPSIDDRLDRFLLAWQKGDFAGQPLYTPQGQPLDAAAAKRTLTDVEGELAAHRPALTKHGKATVRGADATQRVGVSWPLPDGRTWTYDTTVHARKLDKAWQIYFDARTVHPDLHEDQHLTLQRSPAKRGVVLAADDSEVVSEIPVVYVGLEPRFVEDVDAVVQHLDLVFRSVRVDVDVSALPARLRAAKPDAFVDVVTLRRTDYAEIETDLRNTRGVTTRTGTLSLPLTRTFARALLGTSGPATKELIDASAGTLQAGDITGLTGLQRRYDTLLRGGQGLAVVAAPASSGAAPLFTAPPLPGGRLRTTLDVRTQQAAEAALATTPSRSALVAVRLSDGAVLAVANGPDAAGYNLAFQAELPAPLPAGAAPATLGYGLEWHLGADAFTGAAASSTAVGSPLVHAAAVAALSRGHWKQPVLIRDPAVSGALPDGPALPSVASPVLAAPGMVAAVSGSIAYCLYVESATAEALTTIANSFLSAVPK